MEKLRIGIIGAGGITAILHLPELVNMPNVKVVLLGGRTEERLRTLCGAFDVPKWTTNYRDVLAEESVDAVVIATPHPLHVCWGLEAIAAGKHVLMQKPMCSDMAEADALVKAVQKTNRTVVCMPHFSNTVRVLKRMCYEGAIGRISGAHCRTSHGGPEIYYAGVRDFFGETDGSKGTSDLWFFDAQQAAVGALFDMGVYAVANLVAILGTMKRVSAMSNTFDKPTTLEDSATLLMEMENGGIATAETSWCDPARSRELSIHGTTGKITQSSANGISLWKPTSYTDEDASVASSPINVGAGSQNVHEHFHSCVRAEGQSDLSHASNARHVTEILLSAMDSANNGTTISLRTTATP